MSRTPRGSESPIVRSKRCLVRKLTTNRKVLPNYDSAQFNK